MNKKQILTLLAACCAGFIFAGCGSSDFLDNTDSQQVSETSSDSSIEEVEGIEKDLQQLYYIELAEETAILNLAGEISDSEISSLKLGEMDISEDAYGYSNKTLRIKTESILDLPFGETTFTITAGKNTYNGKAFVLTQLITTASELVKLHEYNGKTLENGSYSYDGYFMLGNNINADGYEIVPYATWSGHTDALGREEEGFHGVFDGQGYTVDGLGVGGLIAYGIFGTIGQGGVVKNVAFTNVKYTTHRDDCAIAGLAANVFAGTIENVFFHSTMAFFTPITYVAGGSNIKDLVFYGNNYAQSGFSLMCDNGNENGIQEPIVVENVFCIANVPTSHYEGLEEVVWFDSGKYLTNIQFGLIDFEEKFDCSKKGFWKISDGYLFPIFKTSNLGI